ncbi:PilZ domain-containing protein [bacterium]|nr:PilZ domain-containing protein [bacterium]
MKKRPLAIALCSLALFYFPAEIAARYSQGYGVSWLDVVLSGVLPAIVGWGLLRVTKIGWYTLIAFVFLMGLNDLSAFYRMEGQGFSNFASHLIIFGLSLGYFINPRIRSLYFDPKLCWWKPKPRYETHLPLMVHDGKSWHYPILRNVSESGCFIEMAHPMPMGAQVHLAIPLPIPLSVPVIHTEALVRWSSTNPLRCGMGVEFETPAPIHKRAIKQYVQHQL